MSIFDWLAIIFVLGLLVLKFITNEKEKKKYKDEYKTESEHWAESICVSCKYESMGIRRMVYCGDCCNYNENSTNILYEEEK